MASNIGVEIEKRVLNLNKDIKELHKLLGEVSENAQKSNNNKLIFIRRDVDKLKSASNYLNNLDLPKSSKERRESSFNEDITALYDETLKNVSKMQELFKRQEEAEKKDLHYNGRFFSDQKNLDNLRLAHSNIRQMQIGFSLSKKDWNEIEKK